MATIQIRTKELVGAKDFPSFLAKLNEKYDGKWVAILENGELIARDTVEECVKDAEKPSTKLVFLFHASKRDQLLLV